MDMGIVVWSHGQCNVDCLAEPDSVLKLQVTTSSTAKKSYNYLQMHWEAKQK